MRTEEQAMVQMPRYKCHKEVWALKIAAVEDRLPTIDELDRIIEGNPSDGDGVRYLTPEDSHYGKIAVDYEWIQKHAPQAGGYYVVYSDGYKSYSPAQAFEEGYARI